MERRTVRILLAFGIGAALWTQYNSPQVLRDPITDSATATSSATPTPLEPYDIEGAKYKVDEKNSFRLGHGSMANGCPDNAYFDPLGDVPVPGSTIEPLTRGSLVSCPERP